jgi:spermidine synthase
MSIDPAVAFNADDTWGPRNRTLAILLVSILGLFLEMMLIRWISTEVRIFAYLQNTVLIVCFLGLGMGCFTCRKSANPRRVLLPLLALAVLLALPPTRALVARISDLLGQLNDLSIWYQEVSQSPWKTVAKVAAGLGLTFGLMILLWEIFVPLGRLLGRLMNGHPNTIWAYSVNVAGSLLGVWLFVLLSVFYLPPVIWVVIAGALLFAFLGTGRERLVNLTLLGGVALGAWGAAVETGSEAVVWSPYQKLALFHSENRHSTFAGEYLINVNNVGYQGMIDLSPEGRKKNTRLKQADPGLSQYDIPLLVHPRPERVLVVGAGSGNDVAAALRGGAREVTAVEIDPAIVAMGRALHPERPYDSPRVKVVVEDARAFFATTREKFDVVIFGLLDSHTTTAMTNARLDHYVYTRESLQRARTLLADGGVMVLSFEAFKPFIADRMARALTDVFGEEPISFRVPQTGIGWGGVLFLTGDQRAIRAQLSANQPLAQQVERWRAERPVELTHTTPVTTDDWPYVYLQTRQIPTLYYLLGLLMAALLVYSRFRLREPGLGLGTSWGRSHWHFFFLGAAFLLLEVQNISKASVVLGNTWLVNAVIVSGILLMILLSNYLASALPRLSLGLVAGCLIGSCLGLYFFDLSRLAFLPYLPRAVLAGMLTTLPMLFSGILFIRSFTQVERKDLALGANLIGALVGGMLQSVTFIIGIKALLLVVAALYIAALLVQPRAKESSRAAEEIAPAFRKAGTLAPEAAQEETSSVLVGGAV